MRKFIILFSACFLLFACTKEPAGIDKSPEPLSKSGDAMASMQELAAALPAMFSDNSATKSTYSAAVTDITPLADILWSISQRSATGGSGVMTLSNSVSFTPDTAAVRDIYVVNYEDGFAILSNIPQSPSVLAYAPQGSLTTNTDPNPGLAILLENIPVYANAVVDSLFETHTVFRENKRPDLTTTTTHGQHLTTHWYQGKPFNNKMGNGGCTEWLSDGRYAAGCVAIAVAQIMTYHGFPSVVGGVSHNWALYRTYTGPLDLPPSLWDNVGTLIYDIGQKTNTEYGCSGSSSDIYKAQTAFVNYGYSCAYPVAYNNSNLSTVKSNISASRPLLMTGTKNNSNLGHAWVVDGYQDIKEYAERWEDTYDESWNLVRSVYKGVVNTRNYTMLHFNLGQVSDNELYVLSTLTEDQNKQPFDYPNTAKIIANIQPGSPTNSITVTGSIPNWTIRATYPVASSLNVGCMAADTLTVLHFTLPAGQSSVSVTCNYRLSNIESVSPASDATYSYTY